MMMLNQFIRQFDGRKGVGDTPQNDGECVGLVSVWLDCLKAPHIWGNACDLPANADRSAYSVIPNTPDYVPAPGDIGCFPAGWGGSPVGHTFIVAPGTDVNRLVVFEQNDYVGGGDGSCRLYAFAGYPLGTTFIHPKALDSKQGNDDVITKDDVDTVRIINSEVAGYPFKDTHSGLFDTQEMAAWTDQPFKKLILEKWNQGEAFRNRREAAFVQVTAQQKVIDGLSGQVTTLQTQASKEAVQPSTSPQPGSVVLPDKDKPSVPPVNTANDNSKEPVKEGAKDATRVAVLGAVSYGLTYALDKVVPGLPKNELTVALTLGLRFLDSYIHNSDDIKADGLLPF